jgi:hypothetical protein
VYVPEKQDSRLAYHYDYDVSQHNEDYFAYSGETHYTYYAFDKVKTTIKNTSSEYDFVIGNNMESIPLKKDQPGKMYFLLDKNELTAAGLTTGKIDGLDLDFEGASDFHRVRIRLSNVQDSVLTDAFYPSGEMIEVFFNDLNVADGTNRVQFYQPFDWDGVSSLVVEFSYGKVSGSNPKILGNAVTNKFVQSDNPSTSALEFGGSWGIELDPDIFNTVDDQITIAFWAFGRPQSLPDRNTTVLEGLDENGNRSINIHLPWSNSGIYWDCGNTGGSYDRINKTADPSEFEGGWHHWAFTKNTSTGSMKIYLDGRLWQSGDSKTRKMNVHKFRLGSSVSHNLGYYGMLDEVGFLNTELSEEAIQTLMNGRNISSQPWYNNLLAYYDMEAGSGNIILDASPNQHHASFEGGPEWRKLTGQQIHGNQLSVSIRPKVTLKRGNYNLEHEIEQILDTVITPMNSVIQFAVENSKLVALDTFFLWEAVDSKVYDEEGNELESIYVELDDFLFFEELAFYNFKDSKFELLSLVTPYGNGLDLGTKGKTFTFDVTDFTPILKGNKRLSVEMGGQNQEELDIKFLFIEGTPSREVIDIDNIWPFDRGYYASIQDDKIFEYREVNIPSGIAQAKIRSSVTGHGQNGEFVSRDHRISLNGNAKIFNYTVWKECAFNPIYPQGGTWVYDRAGWCPGMSTDLHEFEITPYITPGQQTGIDYSVIGLHMEQANYLVSNQIVYYGTPNFSLDAALESIVRPNQDAVEFARFNPNCSDPSVIIKNNGTTSLTSLRIIYGVEGVSEKSFNWTGNLSFLESTEVILPVDMLSFYGDQETARFYVRIENPNGGTDEYSNNNALSSTYQVPDVYEGYERWLLRVRTNNRAEENQYRLLNQAGNVVISRQGLNDNTTYDDELDLPPGCYSFEITDLGNDGLSFWHIPAAGSGSVSIRRVVNDNISFEKIRFEADFGGVFNYDFIIDESVDTKETTTFKRVSMYPNPSDNYLNIETEGLHGAEVDLLIYHINGQVVIKDKFEIINGISTKLVDTASLPAGHYIVKLKNNDGSWVKSFVKM